MIQNTVIQEGISPGNSKPTVSSQSIYISPTFY